MKPGGPIRRADSIFCARRAWDHGTEVGFMKSIEDRFQQLADRIINDRVPAFDAEQTYIISSFHALWAVRAEIRDRPGNDIDLHGLMPGRTGWSRDEEEGLEKTGLAFFRGVMMPAHVVNGMHARVLVGQYLRQINPLVEGIVSGNVSPIIRYMRG